MPYIEQLDKAAPRRIPVTHRESGDKLTVTARVDGNGKLYAEICAEPAEFLIGKACEEGED